MVSVSFGRGVFRVEGHAGSAPRGEDLVCAAVSALAQALLHGLIEVTRSLVEVRHLESGLIDARWDEATLSPEARAILATFEGSFRELASRNAKHMVYRRLPDGNGVA